MGCCSCFDGEEKREEASTAKGCTDVFWLIVWILFCMGLVVIAIFSFVYGNPLRLLNGYDSYGNTCGVRQNEKFKGLHHSGMDTRDRKYLFFFSTKDLSNSLKICVKKCPKREFQTIQDYFNDFKISNISYCDYDFDNVKASREPANRQTSYSTALGPCPTFPVYEGKSVLRRCVPVNKSPQTVVKNFYALLNSWDTTEQLLSDIYETWPVITMTCAIALGLSILLIILMHCLTQLISWLICIFVAIASIAITVVLWWAYWDTKHIIETDDRKISLLEGALRNETAIYVLAIISTIVCIFLIVIIFLIRDKLRGLAALFEEAGKCMLALPGLALPPIFAFLALIAFLSVWIAVIVCLATANFPFQRPIIKAGSLPFADATQNLLSGSNDITRDAQQNFSSGQAGSISPFYVEYVDAKALKYMVIYYLVGLIWTSEFIFACQQMSIAGAVVFWYFKKPIDSPTFYAIAKLVKYHLGSVAKGSFLITIFKIPRLILTYLYAKLKKNETNECVACGLRCCICCFWMLEKFIRYLNHNAYTVIAIESINFCPAAGVAWNAMASNIISVGVINGVGDFILFLGKLAVAAVCGLIGVCVLKNNPEIQFYVVPVILMALFGFFIAHVVLSLYEIVVDTLFLCTVEDKHINGNSGRWRESNLAYLLGEEPLAEEAPIQQIEMTQVKEPFRGHF